MKKCWVTKYKTKKAHIVQKSLKTNLWFVKCKQTVGLQNVKKKSKKADLQSVSKKADFTKVLGNKVSSLVCQSD